MPESAEARRARLNREYGGYEGDPNRIDTPAEQDTAEVMEAIEGDMRDLNELSIMEREQSALEAGEARLKAHEEADEARLEAAEAAHGEAQGGSPSEASEETGVKKTEYGKKIKAGAESAATFGARSAMSTGFYTWKVLTPLRWGVGKIRDGFKKLLESSDPVIKQGLEATDVWKPEEKKDKKK